MLMTICLLAAGFLAGGALTGAIALFFYGVLHSEAARIVEGYGFLAAMPPLQLSGARASRGLSTDSH